MCCFQISRHEYEQRIFGDSRREPARHCSPGTGDHLPGGCRARWSFLCGGRGADGVGAMGVAATRPGNTYGTESLVPHRCRQRGRDRCGCAARLGTATPPDTVDRRTRRAAIVAGAIILPFQPSFAAILAIGVVPLIAHPYWREVRTFPSWWTGVSRAVLILARVGGCRSSCHGSHCIPATDRRDRSGGPRGLVAGPRRARNRAGRGARRLPRAWPAHPESSVQRGMAVLGNGRPRWSFRITLGPGVVSAALLDSWSASVSASPPGAAPNVK